MEHDYHYEIMRVSDLNEGHWLAGTKDLPDRRIIKVLPWGSDSCRLAFSDGNWLDCHLDQQWWVRRAEKNTLGKAAGRVWQRIGKLILNREGSQTAKVFLVDDRPAKISLRSPPMAPEFAVLEWDGMPESTVRDRPVPVGNLGTKVIARKRGEVVTKRFDIKLKKLVQK